MSNAKAKINLKEGTIELEGSESFVDKYLAGFQQQLIEAAKNPTPESPPQPPVILTKDELDKAGKKKPAKLAQTVIPIPLDLKGKDGSPPLREFYEQKNPKTLWESLAVFAYYLKEYLKIDRMEAGHVAACCKEVNIKVPTSIPQMFYDIQHQKGWLNIYDKRKFAEINTAGENYVKYDLPRKEDAPKDKAAT